MNALYAKFYELKQKHPHLRMRDAAAKLGIAEAELVACQPHSILLLPQWRDWLIGLAKVGPVMALTRNEAVVMEKTGPFESVECDQGTVAGVYGHAIDLRLFFSSWHSLFFVDGERPSFQAYDREGTATLKVFAVEKTHQTPWLELKNSLTPPSPLTFALEPTAPKPAPSTRPDRVAFNRAWREMTSPHDFFGLLDTFGVTRYQAMTLADEALVWSMDRLSHRVLFPRLAAEQHPVMIFVANRGVTQIHSGPIHELKTVGHWYNILDPDFNLHLKETAIYQAFGVRKPLREGWVTGIELYDETGQLILQLFGERKRGQAEPPFWRALVEQLPKDTTPCLS